MWHLSPRKAGCCCTDRVIQHAPSPLHWAPLMTPFLPETRTALPLPHLCFSLRLLLIPFPPYTFFPFFFLLFSLPFPVISYPFFLFMPVFSAPFQHFTPFLCLSSLFFSAHTARKSPTKPHTLRPAMVWLQKNNFEPWLIEYFRSLQVTGKLPVSCCWWNSCWKAGIASSTELNPFPGTLGLGVERVDTALAAPSCSMGTKETWGTAIKWLCKSEQGFCFKVFSSMNMMWLQETCEPSPQQRSRASLPLWNAHLGISEPVTGCHHWAAEMWLRVHYSSAFKSTEFLRKASVAGSPWMSQHLAGDWTFRWEDRKSVV